MAYTLKVPMPLPIFKKSNSIKHVVFNSEFTEYRILGEGKSFSQVERFASNSELGESRISTEGNRQDILEGLRTNLEGFKVFILIF